MFYNKKILLAALFLFPFWGLKSFAQTMTPDQIKDAESQGMIRYRVSGTYSEKVSATGDASINLLESSIVGQAKMSISGSKSLVFSGISFMNPVNNDSPDLCKYEMQIDGSIMNWLSCTASGNLNNERNQSETVTYTVKNLGSCTSTSKSTSSESSEGVDNLGGINFCFFNPNKWVIEVGFGFKNPKLKATGESQRCEAGQVIKTPIESEVDFPTTVGFNASSDSNGKISFDGKKFVINYSFSKTEKQSSTTVDCGQIPYDLTTSGQGTIEITPITNEIEAIIEPVVGVQSFKEEWLPEGPDVELDTKTGNSAKFRVYLRDPQKPNQHISNRIKEVRYSLDKVSHEPGFAMNYPSENPSTKADLQLNLPDEDADPENEKLAQTITQSQDADFNIKVTSFDYGAYGLLKATVLLDNGKILTAKDLLSGHEFMPIPYRNNVDSRIADQWKEQQKATDLADNYDSDNDDKLENNKFKGDGFTLYEEYRGFIEDKKHIRTDAHKKDLMICDKVKETESSDWQGRSQMGIDMLADITGIVTHSKFRDVEYGKKTDANVYSTPELDTLGLPAFKHDKCMNFNFTRETHDHDQLGLLMLPSPKSLGYAAAFPNVSHAVNPVGNWLCLVITKDFNPKTEGYSSTMGNIDKKGNVVVNSQGKSKIITDEYAVTVAHELLHCCNLPHHGDKKNEGVTNKVKFMSGKTFARNHWQGGDTTKVYALYENEKYATSHEILLFWEDDRTTPILATDTSFHNGKLFVLKNYGVQQGNHSGVEDCVMRYDVANAIWGKDNNFYLIKNKKGTYSELTGITLCNSSTGTGVNAASFKPRPRYGDADTGRGNCKSLVCINDKYK